LAQNPQWVHGKRVLDFGAGSGVAAIAAAKAGALEVVACDLDPLALEACKANAALNEVTLSYSADFFAEADRFDLIIVADVLYDRANLPLLDQFLSRGRQALVADSRVRDFQHPLYQRLGMLEACTWTPASAFAACRPWCCSKMASQWTVLPVHNPSRPSAKCSSPTWQNPRQRRLIQWKRRRHCSAKGALPMPKPCSRCC
jgi:predicted nicotinamide N-methyase